MRHQVDACRESDTAVLDLLRGDAAFEVGELADRLGVTATAVRQRLDRLMRSGLVERQAVARPRGRPAHAYRLTADGRRVGGDNFRDLAMVLWKEVRSVADPDLKGGLLNRIAGSLADVYRGRIGGQTPEQRLTEIAGILAEREIACTVESGPLPILTTYSCPYPDLAEHDHAVCAAERLMLEDLVGVAVHLTECRLDGASCCRFTAVGDSLAAKASASPERLLGLEIQPISPLNHDRL